MIQIVRHRLDGDVDMVQRAIDRIKFFEPYALQMHPNGFYVAYSGGKDSTVIAELCILSGVKFELVNNHTTVDPPELVYHVRNEFKRYRSIGIQCTESIPKETMWTLIVKKKSPPTRIMRYCCDVLKEGGGKDRFVITGVRWAESVARANRSGVFHLGKKGSDGNYIYTNDNDEAQDMMRTCRTKNKRVLNPIIDWTDDEVWEFIKSRYVARRKLFEKAAKVINRIFKTRFGKLKYCKLYDEGFKRLGCIGCPMAGDSRKREFERWPTYKRAYIRAFGKLLDKLRKEKPDDFRRWTSATDIFDWWMEENKEPKQIEGQEKMEV